MTRTDRHRATTTLGVLAVTAERRLDHTGKGGGAPWREAIAAHHRASGTTIVAQANTDPGTWMMPLPMQ